MKRNMDLIRDLLLKIEASPHKLSWKELTPANDNAEVERILAHLKLIEEAGLIKSIPVHMQGYRLPQDIELTWNGHDLLDSIRDPKIWLQTKSGVEGAGGFTVELMKDLAKGFVKKQIEEYTGVKL